MDMHREILSIEIDGGWTAEELSESLDCLIFLYDLRLYLNIREDSARNWIDIFRRGGYSDFPPYFLGSGPFLYRPKELRRFSKIYFPNAQLAVSKFAYASPGKVDLGGIGGIVHAICNFLEFLITLPETKRLSKLQIEKAELEVGELRLQNARIFTQLKLEDARATSEIRQLEVEGLARIVDETTEPLTTLIMEGKITRVSISQNEGSAGREL